MDEPYLRHRQACYWKKISPSVWQWSIGDIGCGFRDITVVRNPKLPASPLIRSEWTAVTPTNQAAGFYRHTTSNSVTTESASSTATLFCKHRQISIVKRKASSTGTFRVRASRHNLPLPMLDFPGRPPDATGP